MSPQSALSFVSSIGDRFGTRLITGDGALSHYARALRLRAMQPQSTVACASIFR
jgi:hypothetical protein